ncbi:MAG: 50S ribosomal protein L9 [Parachlamydiales bacterium]|nr:50S ribosomal protein L9 [Verrucomicrobiota bacterium]MBX3718847.1 50S ribosomal protein L9 [Candidatus Acheromyda pituitae]
MGNQLLLIEDVDDLGRSGDVVSVKPGYARNFLIPQKKAVVADKFTLRLQARLKEERAKQAEVDKTEAEQLAARIDGMVLTIEVKVDPDGHMYGSVTSLDIVRLFEEQDVKLERRNVVLQHPIKQLGVYPIVLKLKEGVPAQITLKVMSEAQIAEEANQ